MLFWILLAAAVVLALLVLGVVAYGVLGAFGRLNRELAAAERDARPLLEQVQATVDRAGATARGPGSERPSA
ncbi:hypothetical protein [Blastococcus litoris]|uniref:hypothetical protein n=1 Tax=Blastococcus litoris TaxID=2171622 RepID=UPI000E304C8B|nr:hypothetical protein [Blastococcus litoris]